MALATAGGARFGHAASVPATHTALKLLDDAGLAGELALRETRTGRVEVVQMWGRPESVREEFRKLAPSRSGPAAYLRPSTR